MMSNLPIIAYAGLSFAWTASVIVAQAVAETGAAVILTQLGVFAICGVIAYWFLKRESADRKEQKAADLAERQELRNDLTLARAETEKEREHHNVTRELLLTAVVGQSSHAQLKVVPTDESP